MDTKVKCIIQYTKKQHKNCILAWKVLLYQIFTINLQVKSEFVKNKTKDNQIKEVKIDNSVAQIELKLKRNYNKALKFMYYVEV